MNHYIFYSKIRNHIASELLKKPESLSEIEQKISFEKDETIFTFCSEAAHIFYTIQDLVNLKSSSDITHALKQYSNILFTHLLKGEKLPAIELILAAAETIAPLV